MAATCLQSSFAPGLSGKLAGLDVRRKIQAASHSLNVGTSASATRRSETTRRGLAALRANIWPSGVNDSLGEGDPDFREGWGQDFGGRWQDDWHGRAASLMCATATQDEVSTSGETAAIIDGQAIAADIRQDIAAEVAKMKEEIGKVPGLAVVLVGSRKDSQTYVRMKHKACEEVGIENLGVTLPEDSTELEVLQAVENLNADPRVHGVLVQLPLPKHMNEERIVGGVSIDKDVDGFHPLNMGRLAMMGREPLFVPCTPKGCIELLLRSDIPIRGKRAVVIGRSNVVGMPAALLLQRHNATVTVVHSYTPDPVAVTREADIVVVAVGVPNLVKGHWLKRGATVIDVGINAVEDASAKRGYRLVGDVCFDEAKHVAGAITPVPKGVGPMTIAMLLTNTLTSAKRAYGLEDC